MVYSLARGVPLANCTSNDISNTNSFYACASNQDPDDKIWLQQGRAELATRCPTLQTGNSPQPHSPSPWESARAQCMSQGKRGGLAGTKGCVTHLGCREMS